MKHFTILKNNFEDINPVIEIMQSLVGNNLEYKEDKEYILFFYEYENIEDIKHLFLALGNEVLIDIVGYISTFSQPKVEGELRLAKDYLKYLPNGIYDFKEALKASLDFVNKKEILSFLLQSSGIDEEFIRVFAENDLNVSKACKAMYMHRNTLNYKLDKFKEATGFDLQRFQDAYLLYHLIQNKAFILVL